MSRSSSKSRFTLLAIAAMFATIVACGGGDHETVIDTFGDAAVDAAVDAPPLVCNAPQMACSGVCVDVSSNEDMCGNCTTHCGGGQVCGSGTCACPPPFISAAPTFGFSGTFEDPPVLFGLAEIPQAGRTDLLYVGVSTTTGIGVPVALPESLGYPFIIAEYDVDLTSDGPPAAIYIGTSGTVTIDKICPETSTAAAGLRGTATNVRFQAIDDLESGPIPGRCEFTVPTVAFSFGNLNCPAP